MPHTQTELVGMEHNGEMQNTAGIHRETIALTATEPKSVVYFGGFVPPTRSAAGREDEENTPAAAGYRSISTLRPITSLGHPLKTRFGTLVEPRKQ